MWRMIYLAFHRTWELPLSRGLARPMRWRKPVGIWKSTGLVVIWQNWRGRCYVRFADGTERDYPNKDAAVAAMKLRASIHE